jgi:hypothetical protein
MAIIEDVIYICELCDYSTHKNKIGEIIKDYLILLFVSKINYSELLINKNF